MEKYIAVCSQKVASRSIIHFFMPMKDMSPSNLTCIYSIMHYIAIDARRYNCTPILTFDQWKSFMIILAEPKESLFKNIVLKLGPSLNNFGLSDIVKTWLYYN